MESSINKLSITILFISLALLVGCNNDETSLTNNTATDSPEIVNIEEITTDYAGAIDLEELPLRVHYRNSPTILKHENKSNDDVILEYYSFNVITPGVALGFIYVNNREADVAREKESYNNCNTEGPDSYDCISYEVGEKDLAKEYDFVHTTWETGESAKMNIRFDTFILEPLDIDGMRFITQIRPCHGEDCYNKIYTTFIDDVSLDIIITLSKENGIQKEDLNDWSKKADEYFRENISIIET